MLILAETASAVATGVVYRLAVEQAHNLTKEGMKESLNRLDEDTFFGRVKCVAHRHAFAEIHAHECLKDSFFTWIKTPQSFVRVAFGTQARVRARM